MNIRTFFNKKAYFLCSLSLICTPLFSEINQLSPDLAERSLAEEILYRDMQQALTDESHDLSSYLRARLASLSFLSKKSKDFADTKEVIDMFKTVIALEKEITQELANASRTYEVLQLYQKAIQTLRTTKVSLSDDVDNTTTHTATNNESQNEEEVFIDENSAMLELDDAIEEFHTNNCEFFMKKTTPYNSALRIALKSFVQIFYNLASYHRALPVTEDEMQQALTKSKENRAFKQRNIELKEQGLELLKKPKVKKSFNYQKLAANVGLRSCWTLGHFFVDEAIPKQSLSWKQAIAELTVPLFIGAGATVAIVKSENKSTLAWDTFYSFALDVFRNLLITRVYLNEHEFPRLFPAIDKFAHAFSFIIDPALALNHTSLSFLLAEIRALTFTFAPDLLNKIKWPPRLNPKHRKRAVTKIIMGVLAGCIEAGFHGAKEAGYLDPVKDNVFKPMKKKFQDAQSTIKKTFGFKK